MKVKKLIEVLQTIDPELNIIFQTGVFEPENEDRMKLVGLGEGNISAICSVLSNNENELWFISQSAKRWLNSMNWQSTYIYDDGEE